jgi:hypothetical protein
MLWSKIRLLIVASMALGVTDCATAPTESNAGPYPENYKVLVRDFLRTSLFDPYTVRDAQIGAPEVGQILIEGTLRHETGWGVCFKANSKNRMGGYTGLKQTLILIRGNRVVGSNSDEFHDVRVKCAAARYEPFADLEELARPSARS